MWSESRARRCLLPLVAVVLAAVVLLPLGGCYRSSGEGDGESAHTETVDNETFTAVREAIVDAGYQVGGRDILMYREGEDRIRAEGEFTAEDGTRYGTVVVERSGEQWKVVDTK